MASKDIGWGILSTGGIAARFAEDLTLLDGAVPAAGALVCLNLQVDVAHLGRGDPLVVARVGVPGIKVERANGAIVPACRGALPRKSQQPDGGYLHRQSVSIWLDISVTGEPARTGIQ